MGFYMYQTDSSFFIDKKDFDKALAAVKALKGKYTPTLKGKYTPTH